MQYEQNTKGGGDAGSKGQSGDQRLADRCVTRHEDRRSQCREQRKPWSSAGCKDQ